MPVGPTLDCRYLNRQRCTHPDIDQERWTPSQCYACRLRDASPRIIRRPVDDRFWCDSLIRRVIPGAAQPARPVRVGLHSYHISTGGIEEWACLLAEQMPSDVAQLTEVVTEVGTGSRHERRLSDRCRLTVSPTYVPDVDVMLFWCSGSGRRWQAYQGQRIFVAHGDIELTRIFAQQHGPSCSALAAVSERSARMFAGMRRDVTVIDNGIPVEQYQSLRRTHSLALDLPRPWLGYVGRWSDEKRPLAALYGAKALGGSAIYLVPDDAREGATKALRQLSDGTPWVIVEQGQKLHLYGSVDACVVCSTCEGGPIVAYEAMAAGCPLLATDVGALPELSARYGQVYTPVPHDPDNLSIDGRDIATAFRQVSSQVTLRAQVIAWKYLNARRMADEWAWYCAQVAGRPGSTGTSCASIVTVSNE